MDDFGGRSITPDTPPTADEKMMALLAHILAPFTCLIGPLVIWIIKKDQSPFVARNAIQALIWGVAMIVAAILLAVITCFIGGFGSLLATVAHIGYAVIAAVKANEGLIYEYPLVGKFANKQ